MRTNVDYLKSVDFNELIRTIVEQDVPGEAETIDIDVETNEETGTTRNETDAQLMVVAQGPDAPTRGETT